jgi:hypothetical protein
VGLRRKQQKPDQASDWVQPGLVLEQLNAPAASPGPGGPQGSGGPPVPARLRPLTAAGASADWMPGALHLSRGSIRWEPAPGGAGESVELASAMIIPPQGKTRGRQDLVTWLQTPGGVFQLDMDPVLFQMSQDMVGGS